MSSSWATHEANDASRSHSQRERRAIAGLVLLHVLVAGFLGASLSINADEACTLTTIARGPVQAFQRALSYELQPPLYFTTLSVWCCWGDPLLVARAFSLLCTTGLLLLVALASRRFLPTVNSSWVVGIAAFNPIVLYAATEARCYALVMFVAAGLLVLFESRFLSESCRRGTQLRFAALSCVGLYTFYPLGFLLASGGVTLIALRRWRAVRDYSITMAGVAVGFLPLAWMVPNQVTTHTVENVVPPTLWESARLVFWHVRNVVLPVSWSWADLTAPIAWSVAAGLTLNSLRRLRSSGWNERHVALCLLVGGMSVLFTLFAQMIGPIFAERHLAPLVGPLLLCAVSVLDRVAGRATFHVALTLVVTFAMSASVVRFGSLSKPGDWRRSAEFVSQHEQPGQTIVVFRPSAALGFEYHYSGRNAIIPLPIAATGEHYDIRKFAMTDPQVIDAALQRSGSPSDHVWVVTELLSESASQEFGAPILEGYFHRHYELLRESQHSGSRVRLFRRTTGVTDVAAKENP